MCENRRALRHLLRGLDNTHIDVLISQLNLNILPSNAFLDGLSLKYSSTMKRA